MNAVPKYYSDQRPEMVAFLQKGDHFAQALDIGCAAGALGAGLQNSAVVGACDGIEPHAEAAKQAEQRLRRVWCGDLESAAADVPWRQYDLIVMADVLEHLVDPWAALRLLRDRTAPHCRLALSVPNVRHYRVVLPLLFQGRFQYRDHGIMDRTHLHFFTRSSLIDALRECGWKPQRIETHMKSRYRRWYCPTRWLEPFVAVQYLLMAEKAA